MPETQLSNPRKRRNPELLTPQQNKTSQHVSKKQKRNYPSGSQLPPAFWDNLSKIDLTKRALEELDRRNTQAAPNSQLSYSRSHRRITRHVLAELKKSSQPLAPAAYYLCHSGTRVLKNIKQTARHGGPDLSNLRGFPEPSNLPNQAMSSTRSNSRVPKRSSTSTSNTKPSTNTTRSTGPYNRNFQQNLIDGGVYPEGYEYPDGRVPPQPDNWEEVNRRLLQPRPSLSPSRFSDEEFRKFKRANAHASKEKQVATSVIPIIEGYIEDAKCVSEEIPFTNLDHLTDGTLVSGNPDIYYGARPEQLDRRVRNELNDHIIPSTQNDFFIAPNFFLAAKGPDGSSAVADRQASYDGALGARGMHSLQSYGQEKSIFDKNAFTITSIYHDGQLKMYTSHSSQSASPGDQREYFTNQLNTWGMTGNIETFRQGATAYRNARDWAKEQREEAIRRVNKRAGEFQVETLAVDASFERITRYTSETTVEEDSRLSQESRSSLNETSNTTTDLQESDASSCDLASDVLPIKRSSKHSKQSSQSQRKRHNAGGSDYDLSRQSVPQTSGPSRLSQQFENQFLGQEPDSSSSRDYLQPITPDTSTRTEKPAPKRKMV